MCVGGEYAAKTGVCTVHGDGRYGLKGSSKGSTPSDLYSERIHLAAEWRTSYRRTVVMKKGMISSSSLK